jgi:hypothetical protein
MSQIRRIAVARLAETDQLRKCDEELALLSQELEALELAVYCLESKRRELDRQWSSKLYERDRLAEQASRIGSQVGT